MSAKRKHVFISVQSIDQSCPTLCDPMNRSTPGLSVITNSRHPPKPMSIESVLPSNHLILCCPFLLLPSVFPGIRVLTLTNCAQLLSRVRLFATLRTVALQAPLSMGILQAKILEWVAISSSWDLQNKGWG